jgi:hypothetical protein
VVEEEDEEESEANGMESRSARRPRLRGGGSTHRRARPVRTHRPHGRFLIDGADSYYYDYDYYNKALLHYEKMLNNIYIYISLARNGD